MFLCVLQLVFCVRLGKVAEALKLVSTILSSKYTVLFTKAKNKSLDKLIWKVEEGEYIYCNEKVTFWLSTIYLLTCYLPDIFLK